MSWLLYGSNGYTGRLIVERCIQLGLRPILGGRNRRAVEALASRSGLEARAFALEPSLEPNALSDVSLVLNVAGPFSATCTPLLRSCLDAGVHYLDISGEPDTFEHCYEHHERARERGVVVLPGVGADVVPSDCLALALKDRLPDATHLELAMASDSGPSRGTLSSIIRMNEGGAWVRRDGQLCKVPVAAHRKRIPFASGPRTAATMSWGDVSSAFRSTAIRNVEVLMALPGAAFLPAQLRLMRLSPVRAMLLSGLARKGGGPTADERSRGRLHFWGRAWNEGAEVSGRLETINGYSLTAITAVEIASRIDAGRVPFGATTPAAAFGPRFVEEYLGVRPDLREGSW